MAETTIDTFVPLRSRSADPDTSEAPREEETTESVPARVARVLGWGTLGAVTVAAASVVGVALSLICAVAALVAGVIAVALLVVTAAVVAVALLAFAALLLVLGAGALALGALAGTAWIVTQAGRAVFRIGRGSSRAAYSLIEPSDEASSAAPLSYSSSAS